MALLRSMRICVRLLPLLDRFSRRRVFGLNVLTLSVPFGVTVSRAAPASPGGGSAVEVMLTEFHVASNGAPGPVEVEIRPTAKALGTSVPSPVGTVYVPWSAWSSAPVTWTGLPDPVITVPLLPEVAPRVTVQPGVTEPTSGSTVKVSVISSSDVRGRLPPNTGTAIFCCATA